MNRSQLEHLIRATASISEDNEIVVVGSQSVLNAVGAHVLGLVPGMGSGPWG
jgi:hypothetical protein